MLSTDLVDLFCGECIATMPGSDFAIWLILSIAGTAFGLRLCHKKFKWARLIEDMPTSRIRSASQGFTELVGVAKLQGNPQLAPLTSSLCLWWRFTIEKYQSTGKSSHWVTVDKDASNQPFYLQDNTGICRVDPEGAEISCQHKQVWYGSTRRPVSAPEKKSGSGGFLSLASARISFGGRYRYTEQLIIDGDPLYSLGHFETDATGQRSLTPNQLMGNILGEWKQDFPALLAMFDSNGDGELDLKEWKVVRDAAHKEGHRQQQLQAQQPAEHVLGKPQHRGLPFIIGSHEQEHLSRRFRYTAMFFSAAFLVSGSMATWLISSRFAG